MPSEASSSSSQLLLSSSQHDDSPNDSPNDEPSSFNENHPYLTRWSKVHTVCRARVKAFLASRAQHYTVLGLVSFDLLGIFADIIINLYQCDEGDTDPKWDDVREGLGIAGLVFSCLFLVELIASIWAFGWRFVFPFFYIYVFWGFRKVGKVAKERKGISTTGSTASTH
jgi:hypothetical protein